MFITVKWLSTSCTTEMLENDDDYEEKFIAEYNRPQHAIVCQEHGSLDHRLNDDIQHRQANRVYYGRIDSIINLVLHDCSHLDQLYHRQKK